MNKEEAEKMAKEIVHNWALPGFSVVVEGNRRRELENEFAKALLSIYTLGHSTGKREMAKEACEILTQIPAMMGHGVHWDTTMRGGAGCPKCIEQREIASRAAEFVKKNQEKL